MFPTGGYVTADTTEDSRTIHGAKAAGYLLLQLAHSDVAFCLIVRKGHFRYRQKAKDFRLVFLQPVKQASGFASGRTPLFPLLWRWKGTFLLASSYDRIIFPKVGFYLLLCQHPVIFVLVESPEQLFHLYGPLVAITFVASFKFPEQMPLKVGEENSYTVTVNLDGTQLSRTSSVKDLAFQTTKRVLVEEATGQWCTNCPRGILALENLEQLFGDDVVSIGVHGTGNSGQDIFAYDSYCNSLGFTAFPSGVVNRIDTLYQPTAVIYGETGSYYSFNSPSGNMTFLDIVQREFSMNPIAEADINVTKADYDTQKKTVTVDGGVNYAVNLKNLNQNILFVIVENGLEGVQANNCYTSTDPLMGRFGKGGELGQPNPTVTFNHVARRVLDEYYTGMAGLIPVNVTANSPVEFTLERTAPDNVVNWANAELVVAVLNNNTGQVVNVVKVPFTIDGTSGIGSVNASGEDISINSENGMINVNASGDVNVAVYDASGSLVGTKAGSGQVSIATANGGLYIVKATVDGASVVKKVVVR